MPPDLATALASVLPRNTGVAFAANGLASTASRRGCFGNRASVGARSRRSAAARAVVLGRAERENSFMHIPGKRPEERPAHLQIRGLIGRPSVQRSRSAAMKPKPIHLLFLIASMLTAVLAFASMPRSVEQHTVSQTLQSYPVTHAAI